MSALAGSAAAAAEAPFRDYFRLLKPRVMSLAVFTAVVGMCVAPVTIHPVIGLAAAICIAAGAGAAGALNMWWDADIDQRMARTASRPVPAGRLPPETARDLGIGLGCMSTVLLALFTHPLAGALLGATIVYYAVIYTMWLKRRTAQSVVIGGIAGALPPLVGWAAATGSVAAEPLLMALVILLWTPPHSWALALMRRREYADAAVPMLPATAGVSATRRQIAVYTVLLFPAGVGLALTPVGGWASLAAALIGGGVMLWRSAALFRNAAGSRPEGRLFGASIAYLFFLFTGMLVDWLLEGIAVGPGILAA